MLEFHWKLPRGRRNLTASIKDEETAVQSGENGTTLELPDCCNFRADRVPEKFRLRSGLVENVQQFRLEENEECPLCYLRRMTFNDRFKRFVWLLIWIWRGQQFVRLWLVRPWPIRNQFRTSCFALKRTLWSLQWNFVEKARRSDGAECSAQPNFVSPSIYDGSAERLSPKNPAISPLNPFLSSATRPDCGLRSGSGDLRLYRRRKGRNPRNFSLISKIIQLNFRLNGRVHSFE